MNSRKVLILLGSLISLGLLVLCLSIWPVQPGCPYLKIGFRKPCEYSRTFSANKLLVDSSSFNERITLTPVRPLNQEGAAERVLVEIWANGRTIGSHEIQRWATSKIAEEKYKTIESVGDLYVSPCSIASNIEFTSSTADNFCAACSTGRHCKSVAQYQDYISVFEYDLYPGYSEADFSYIVEKIDQRFANILNLELTQEP